MIGPPGRVLAHIADAMAETMSDIRVYRKKHPAFAEIGERMIQMWGEGMRGTLRVE